MKSAWTPDWTVAPCGTGRAGSGAIGFGARGRGGALSPALIRIVALQSHPVLRHDRAMFQGYPIARPGQVIGLLGGSFDPAHEGHAHITREALKRFGLDRVWWLVSPGNPLKAEGPAPLARRLDVAGKVIQHPRVVVTDVETRMGTRYTAETLAALIKRYPGVRFVWLMGADNLASFHRWDQWRKIMETVPIGVLARPGDRSAARHSIAASTYRNARLKGRNSILLPQGPAPLWCFVNVPMVNMSSSDIRARGDWVR